MVEEHFRSTHILKCKYVQKAVKRVTLTNVSCEKETKGIIRTREQYNESTKTKFNDSGLVLSAAHNIIPVTRF